MKKLILLLLIGVTLLAFGCSAVDWNAAWSVGDDLAKLRVDREVNGQPHIEDIFKKKGDCGYDTDTIKILE
jgi:hypothetical protein